MYLITDFEGVYLPPAMTEDDLGVGRSNPALMDSVGGVYDYWQDQRRLPRKRIFRHKGKFETAQGTDMYRATVGGSLRVTTSGEVRVTALSAAHELQARIDFLKSRIGQRGRLWRKSLTNGVRTWKQCRLLDVKHIAKVDDAMAVAEVETEWETADVGWRSAQSSIVQGSGTNISLAVANAGNVPMDDAVISIARETGTVTQVTITAAGIALRWTGSLGAGQTLVIDCERQTVRVNGVDAYAGFSLLPSHSANGWLPLRTGMTAVSVAALGGDVTASVEHYNQWA